MQLLLLAQFSVVKGLSKNVILWDTIVALTFDAINVVKSNLTTNHYGILILMDRSYSGGKQAYLW